MAYDLPFTEEQLAEFDRAHHAAKVSGSLDRWSDCRALNEQNQRDTLEGAAS
ncbi:hypothetical protein [Variovorax sp. PAMC 28711]|uniref:hypothetical protein n=1 Tax=Variovorax sp. PAMC 28711 TaxID=1795631 RepID=UPI000A416856|nr:hypothetical protein [Variovorax sp. PAMC 28711]